MGGGSLAFFFSPRNAVAQKRLHQSSPEFHAMFISHWRFVGKLLGIVGATLREVRGVEAPPKKSSTSDFHRILIKLEHMGKLPRCMKCHWSQFSRWRIKGVIGIGIFFLFFCPRNAIAQKCGHQSNPKFTGMFISHW